MPVNTLTLFHYEMCIFAPVMYVVCVMCVQDESLDYDCLLDIENQSVVVDASVEPDITQPSVFFVMCQPYQVRMYFSICETFYPQFLFSEAVIELPDFDLNVTQLPNNKGHKEKKMDLQLSEIIRAMAPTLQSLVNQIENFSLGRLNCTADTDFHKNPFHFYLQTHIKINKKHDGLSVCTTQSFPEI